MTELKFFKTEKEFREHLELFSKFTTDEKEALVEVISFRNGRFELWSPKAGTNRGPRQKVLEIIEGVNKRILQDLINVQQSSEIDLSECIKNGDLEEYSDENIEKFYGE